MLQQIVIVTVVQTATVHRIVIVQQIVRLIVHVLRAFVIVLIVRRWLYVAVLFVIVEIVG